MTVGELLNILRSKPADWEVTIHASQNPCTSPVERVLTTCQTEDGEWWLPGEVPPGTKHAMAILIQY